MTWLAGRVDRFVQDLANSMTEAWMKHAQSECSNVDVAQDLIFGPVAAFAEATGQVTS